MQKASIPLLIFAMLFPDFGDLEAALLDWDAASWTAGSLTGSFNIDPLNAGDDVTITIAGSAGPTGFQAGSPTIDQSKTGGLSPVENSLNFLMDWSSRNDFVTVTVVFNYAQGVNNVNFSLLDIDTGTGTRTRTFIDQIQNIQALDMNSNAVACDPAQLNLGSAVTSSGSGLGLVLSGNATAADTTSQGNATIDFGTAAVQQFSFDYGNKASGNPRAQANPAAQSISFHDVNFSPVPEVGVMWGAVVVCVLAILIANKRRRQFSKPYCAP